MATTIEVNKQSVKTFLETGKDHPFVIPEYQRPYAWGEDQVQTLFEDLWEFSSIMAENKDRKSTYFLGSIVAYENEAGEQEIIDGQQRITSLFLLLRAIYKKLEDAPEKNERVKNFMNKIEPTLWRADDYTGEPDFEDILLDSRVLNNDGNAVIHTILRKGTADPDAKDNYSKNYIKFLKLYEEASEKNPLMIYDFILTILNQAILLPITADTQDTALTIFSTLNDRGLPLSDADIFKAKIYNHLDAKEKSQFIEKWKELDSEAMDTEESIQQLFYYYMFYLRAIENDNKTTTPGIRKYYSSDKFKKLFEADLLTNLDTILNLWKVIKVHDKIDDEPWSSNMKILQTLDILTSYPNEFWKYPVIIYYLVHRKKDCFEEEFGLFLNKLLLSLMTTYLVKPTINEVKSSILKLNIAIISSTRPQFEFKDIDTEQLIEKIKNPHRSTVRMLLKILAYQKQDTLLPEKWEIEHIFPQKWQSNYSSRYSDSIIKERIEHLGNKLPFEKRLNIVAGNEYFEKKKVEYAASQIIITNEMKDKKEWELDSIIERDSEISKEVVRIIKGWDKAYTDTIQRDISGNKAVGKEVWGDKICCECGAACSSGMKFCPECGAKFENV